MKRKLVALAAAGAVLLVACGGGNSDESVEGQDVTVAMYDNRYQYTEIRIPVGGTVTFVGGGRNPHNAVAAGGDWSTEDVFGSLDQYEDDAAQLTFDQPGEYVFFCTYHGNAQGGGMSGVLIVGGD